MYLKWVLLFFVDILSNIFGRLLAPFVVPFANKEGWLPNWLSWFQTPDNSLDGDSGHLERWQRNGWFWTYMRRVAWLLRNNMYGFTIDVMGVDVMPWQTLVVEGDAATSNRPLHNGKVFRRVDNDCWQLYYVKAWSKSRCIRINLGWKLWNIEHERAMDPQVISSCQYVFSVNPFMGYEK